MQFEVRTRPISSSWLDSICVYRGYNENGGHAWIGHIIEQMRPLIGVKMTMDKFLLACTDMAGASYPCTHDVKTGYVFVLDLDDEYVKLASLNDARIMMHHLNLHTTGTKAETETETETETKSVTKLKAEFNRNAKRCREIKRLLAVPVTAMTQSDAQEDFVPPGFNYTIKDDGTLFAQYATYIRDDTVFLREAGISLCNDMSKVCQSPLPYTGLLTLSGIEMYVQDHHKSGTYYISFKSKEEYLKLAKLVYDAYIATQPKSTDKCIHLYRWSAHQANWVSHGQCDDYSKFGLIGYGDYLDQIQKEIGIHMKYLPLLTSIGEARSLNYALQGPPGVGKTTLIKSLASLMKIPVCIVNPTEIRSNMISKVLNPTNIRTDGVVLVVFEDFDRFLTGKIADGQSIMSQILNALDGFEDNSNVVRFFTANNPEVIASCDALKNRMSRIFRFNYPMLEDYVNKFDFLLKRLRSEERKYNPKINKFFEEVARIPRLTLRPYTTYVVRYLLEPVYLNDGSQYEDHLLKNIDELRQASVPPDIEP